jgi:glucokinase
MSRVWGAVAIGGTKCSVSVACPTGDTFSFIERRTFPTDASPERTLGALVRHLGAALAATGAPPLAGIGIVCGGPLDESKGLVLGPPNLPGWEAVEVVRPFEDHFGERACLQNDANAGVLAEWTWGAARGCDNVVFLTCGTGLGAGLILNGRLFRGSTGLAGEVGHWRLATTGPVGYGKAGSFEGFCAGSGIARAAQELALQYLQQGSPTALSPGWRDLEGLSAKRAAEAAESGDPVATRLWAEVGRRLGSGIALLVDLLNPDVIVLGGIYVRQRDRLQASLLEELEREALPQSVMACRVVPSALGEHIGDWSGLAAALLGDETTPAGRRVSGATRSPTSVPEEPSPAPGPLAPHAAAVPHIEETPTKMEERQ